MRTALALWVILLCAAPAAHANRFRSRNRIARYLGGTPSARVTITLRKQRRVFKWGVFPTRRFRTDTHKLELTHNGTGFVFRGGLYTRPTPFTNRTHWWDALGENAYLETDDVHGEFSYGDIRVRFSPFGGATYFPMTDTPQLTLTAEAGGEPVEILRPSLTRTYPREGLQLELTFVVFEP